MPQPLLRFALLALAFVFAVAVPRPALAVNGLDALSLVWGMSPEQVKAAHTTKHEKELKSQPEGTVGGRLLLTRDVEMFGERLEVALYFSASGLSIIRLEYRQPREGNIEKLVDWYRPHWGEALTTSERSRGRKNKTWAWPWEGVEIRSVEEDGKTQYQRLDFSAAVSEEWRRADAMLCTVLPTTTGCPFAGTTCPQQDSAFASGKRDQEWALLDSKGALSCTYEGYRLKEMRLTFERPREKTSKWLEELLLRRIGTGLVDREESSSRVKVERTWLDHQLQLRVDRKSVSKKEDGTWTGPVEHIRLKMELAAPSAQPIPAQSIELTAPPQ